MLLELFGHMFGCESEEFDLFGQERKFLFEQAAGAKFYDGFTSPFGEEVAFAALAVDNLLHEQTFNGSLHGVGVNLEFDRQFAH